MRNSLLFISILFVLSSCLKNNPDASWIKINKWDLQDNPSVEEGQLTESFSNVKILIDGNVVGIFELPVKIPILKEGNRKIQLYPVIVNNGISSTKKVYPFVSAYNITKELIPNDTIEINPTTSYLNSTKFWLEDFDGATIKIKEDDNSTAEIVSSDDPAIIQPFNGNQFGRVDFTTTKKSWIAFTGNNNDGINIPKGVDAFLEIDYYINTNLKTGVLGIGSNGVVENPMIRLNASSSTKWKKVYIELKEVVTGLSNAAYYKISFRASLGENVSSGQINIDNVKVVYF